jgi:hypothetical protein
MSWCKISDYNVFTLPELDYEYKFSASMGPDALMEGEEVRIEVICGGKYAGLIGRGNQLRGDSGSNYS